LLKLIFTYPRAYRIISQSDTIVLQRTFMVSLAEWAFLYDVLRAVPTIRIVASLAWLGLQAVTTALGQTATPAEFFRGKTVSILVGFEAGGGYDLYARVLARFLGRHIPGQLAVIVQNMPGAGGLRAARHLAGVAPKDGTALLMPAQTLPFDTALGYTPDIDAGAFNWIGRIAMNVEVGVVFARSGITSIETARNREILTGGTGGTASSTVLPLLLNKLAGTRFKLIAGYNGANDVLLAMQRGEVEMVGATGISTMMAQHAAWLSDGTARLIYQSALARHPAIPDVPRIGELGAGIEDKQILDLYAAGSAIGRVLVAPPGVPADRVAVLRRAMASTLADPEMLAYARGHVLALDVGSSDELNAIVRDMLATPKPVVSKAREILETLRR
jgi:tripartite-type tricarboxylate transporter receptor subunit TctC